jgi:hypothetical protein
MSEWKDRRLEDVVQLKRGFDLATRDRRSGPYPVVGSAGISGWHDEGPIPGPALVLGRAGASMGVASFCETERFWPLNTALFVEDFKGNDPRFVFHLFQVTDLTGFDSGSVQPMLNRNYIRNVIVRIPERDDQRAISGVLQALDSKIAVNYRITETARELARAHFRAAQDAEDSEQVNLNSIAEFLNRGVTPRYTEDPSQLRVLNQKCIRDGRAEPEIESLGQGSTGQTELGRAQLSSLKITVPSKKRAAELRPVLNALENRGDSALEESLSLAQLRDTLLPRLMSGDIRVREAEKVVEDVT